MRVFEFVLIWAADNPVLFMLTLLVGLAAFGMGLYFMRGRELTAGIKLSRPDPRARGT